MKLQEFSKLKKDEMLFVIEANKGNPAAPFYLERIGEALDGKPESIAFLGEEVETIYKKLKR
jgi:hypothetical protein